MVNAVGKVGGERGLGGRNGGGWGDHFTKEGDGGGIFHDHLEVLLFVFVFFAGIFVIDGFGIIDHPDDCAMIIEDSASAGALCEVGGDGHKRLIASGITPEGVAGYVAAGEEIELAVGVTDHADGRADWGGSGGEG